MEICNYCKKEIPLKLNNEVVLSGFFDADTKVNCCNNCKNIHYSFKQKTKFKGLYSEYPIVKVIENIVTVPNK